MKAVDGYIVINNDTLSFSFNDLFSYLQECRKSNKKTALKKLIIKKFDLNINIKFTDVEIKKYLRDLLKSNKFVDKYYDDDDDFYNNFYEAVCIGIDNFPYSQRLDEISESISKLGRSMVDLVNNTCKVYFNEEAVQSLKDFSRVLLSFKNEFNDSKSVRNNVDKMIEYGWVITFELEDYVLFNRVSNMERTNQDLCKFYNKSEIKKIEDEIIMYLKFDPFLIEYFNEAKTAFLNKLYYSCSTMLFAIIDRLISMNFEKRNIGKSGVNKLNDSLINEDFYNGHLTYSTMTVLINLYAPANDFKLSVEIFNRNMLDHGWMKRKVYSYECLQLLLVIKNLLFILNKETDIMPKTLKKMGILV